MCVDACVSGGPCEVFVFPVRNMLVCACITILLGKTKINDVDKIALLSQTHEEVVWLYISMNEVLGMNVLNSVDLGVDKFTWHTSEIWYSMIHM